MHARLHLIASTLLAGLLLTACGGGGDDTPKTPAPDVPDEALVSSAGYTEWARGLRGSDSTEPLSMDRLVDVPSSETDEPVPLD